MVTVHSYSTQPLIGGRGKIVDKLWINSAFL